MNKKSKIGLIMLALIISIISTKVYATTGKVNQETIRMRKEASTDSNILTLISLNEEVEILTEENEWYKIKYKTYTGYIRKDMLDVQGQEESKNNETAQNTASENTQTSENTTSENVQETSTEATTESAPSEESQDNDEENQNQTGLATSEEEQNTVSVGYTGKISSKLDLKIIPSITSSNINTVDENTEITIKDIINKWSYVETEGKAGWVLTSKIKVEEEKTEEAKQEEKVEEKTDSTSQEEKQEQTNKEQETTKKEESKTKTAEATKYISTETLNMRETADNNAKLVSQLKINTKVTVVETSGTWSKIKVNGKTGYVASKYLSDKKVDVTSRSEELDRGTNNSQKEEKTENKESTKQETTASSSSSSGNAIVACAKKYLGCRYVSGGSSPSTGFDCSGFTSYVYKQCGISISRSSGAQASNGTAVSKANLQPGDLVLFNNRANTSVGHVGIYIGGNTFIHAGNSGTGVITTSLSDSYYQSRYVTGRRIIN